MPDHPECYAAGSCQPGNRNYHENPEQAAMIRLKSGTLDNQDLVGSDLPVWTNRKSTWRALPECGRVVETLDTPAEMIVASQLQLAEKQA